MRTFAACDGIELLLALDAAEAVPVVVADAGHHLLGLEHLRRNNDGVKESESMHRARLTGGPQVA